MFERYTESARRVIFFARYEASHCGSATIETEHLLLGLIRENKNAIQRLLPDPTSFKAIRETIESQIEIREKISTSIDLPLSSECKQILAYAADEAEHLSQKQIGIGHLLLGILREENCFAAKILTGMGLEIEAVRKKVLRTPAPDAENLRGSFDQGIVGTLGPRSPLPAAGVVPDVATAKRIAEAVWLPRVNTSPGDDVTASNAVLMYGVWVVTGSHNRDDSQTTLAAFIQKEDAKILRIHMEKAAT